MVIIGKPLTFRYYPYPDTTPYITRMPHLHYTVRKTGIGHRTETLSININVHLNHLAYPPGHVVFFFLSSFFPRQCIFVSIFSHIPLSSSSQRCILLQMKMAGTDDGRALSWFDSAVRDNRSVFGIRRVLYKK